MSMRLQCCSFLQSEALKLLFFSTTLDWEQRNHKTFTSAASLRGLTEFWSQGKDS